ncbi:MAG: DUF302 domain-containing protein [Magnetococcales bacterium]|nr:DUF302 domain-containing protein [Magnetococcales bacterium]
MKNVNYSIVKQVSSNYTKTVERITKALADQGFGVLTQIDIAATLKKKIDVDYPRTIILGACNPPIAYKALTAVPDIAVLLPCNVVVRENQQKEVEIVAMDPMILSHLMDNPEVNAIAADVDQRIRAAINSVE